MERQASHATRSKGIKPVNNPYASGSKVPVALKKLQSSENWNFKPSGCRLPSLERDLVVIDPPPNSNVASLATNKEVEQSDLESYSRFIGETMAIRDLFEEAAICGHCKKGKLDVSFETKCLATVVHTKCRKCLAHSASTTFSTSIPQENQDRNTNYASNVLFVLAQILSGNGGTETSRIVGMLDLPNPSIGDTAFPSIEYELGKYIIPLSKEFIRNNLLREVELYAETTTKFDYPEWKENHSVKPELIAIEQLPLLTVGYDMGWQKRSSGHRYDSHSGHAIPVGVLTNLPVGLAILNRYCRVCSSSTNDDPGDHDCTSNFTGASGAMESAALVEIAHGMLDDDHVLLGTIVADDDSSMRAHMKWSNADWMINNGTTEPPRVLTKGGKSTIRPDRGQLRREYPEPQWLNDPSHRGKTLGGDLRSIEKQPKAVSKGINKVDCIKLHRNFGYMIKQLKQVPEEEWISRGKAVLEHHFENHEYCGPWCSRKNMSVAELENDRKKTGKYYRCKVRDAIQYGVLQAVMEKYIGLDKLREVAHGYSTQKNESLNNNVSWLAQKNKTLSGSKALSIRVHLAVGITIAGYKPFIQELLRRMGIQVSQGTSKHLRTLWEQKKKNSSKRKEASFKNERNEKRRAKLADEIKQAEKKRRTDGFYKPGEGFNLCLPIIDPTQKKMCRAGCGSSDHLTSQSKKCPFNIQNKVAKAQSQKSNQEEEIRLLKKKISELERVVYK
jgi:hypothetical protein